MKLKELLNVVDEGTIVHVKNKYGKILENLYLPNDKSLNGDKDVLIVYPARDAYSNILIIYLEESK